MSENVSLTQSASATVTALREEVQRWGTSSRLAVFPTVRFEAQDGRTVETEFWMWLEELPNFRYTSWWRPAKVSSFIKVGDEVTVVYDPQHLETVQLESVERRRREQAQEFRATVEGCFKVAFVMAAVIVFGTFLVVVFLLLAFQLL
jgi:hypothetical protein